MFGKKSHINTDDIKVSNGDAENLSIENAVDDFRLGSAEAFQILYRKYSQKVYRFCFRILGDEAKSKDAFQETFIKVYENRLNFKSDNFAAWLFTIARHNCLNQIRRSKDYESIDDFHSKFSYSDDTDIMLKHHIELAIAKLPLAMREAVILREYEECSYQEIAEILGIDLSLAKIRVHRGRILLRKILEPIVKEINESR